MSRRLKTPCATPGAVTSIHTGPHSFSVTVQMPLGVDLGSLSEDDVSYFHDMIHEYGEEIAFRMIRQSRMREGKFDAVPDHIPNARASDDDHNAMEIIRRSAARLLAADPSLGEDA